MQTAQLWWLSCNWYEN